MHAKNKEKSSKKILFREYREKLFNPLQPGVSDVFRGYRKVTPGRNGLKQ